LRKRSLYSSKDRADSRECALQPMRSVRFGDSEYSMRFKVAVSIQ